MSNVPTNLIPTTVTGLPEYTGSSTLGYLPYVVDGRTYKVQFSNIAAVGAVPSSRTVATGTGLTGGGDLSANRTIAIANGGVGTAQLAASGVSAGVYGSGTLVPVLTVDATGRVTSATTAAVSVSGFVPTSRSVIAGTGLTGGGALSSDVTLNVNFSSSTPQALGTATAGVSTAAARGDHVHPAVNLADTSQTQGALPLGRGGTGDALSPVAGAVVYSTGTRFALTALGLPGQVLMSDGANAPQWATVSGIGTVTSVNVSGGTTGLTFSGGPVTAAGTITMAGTLAVGNGGTGLTSLTANFIPKGNGTAAFSASQIFDNGTNVGIGTTSPSAKLHVVGNALFTGASSQTLDIGTSTGIAYIQSYGAGTAATPIVFYTGTSERMRITATGDLLVGTATALSGTRAVVAGGLHAQALAANGTPDGYADGGGIMLSYASSVGSIRAYANASGTGSSIINFLTAGTERMRIDATGLVGIGMTPTYRLDVQDASASSGIVARFKNSGSTGAVIQLFQDTVGSATIGLPAGSANLRFSVGATDAMFITTVGNVGIGTTSPGYRLDVANADGSALARFKDSDSAHNGIIIAGDINGGWVGNNAQIIGEGIYYQNAINAMRVYTNSLERMRITDTGRVGIGTTSPEATLTVTGTAGAITGAGFAVVESSTGNNARLRIIQSAGFVTYDATYSTGGNQQVWSNAGAERMRLTEAGTLFVGKTAASVGTDGVQFIPGGFSGFSAPGTTALFLNRNTSDGTILEFGRNGVSAATMGLTSSALTVSTAGTERMRIESTGAVVFPKLTLSTDTPFLTGANINSAANPLAIGTTGSGVVAFFTNNVERMRVKTNGQVRFIPLAAAPAGPEAGDVYYDSTTNKLRCYNGTTWNDLF